MKGVWRFASMRPGEQSVMVSGPHLMPTLLADSLDSLPQVRKLTPCDEEDLLDYVLAKVLCYNNYVLIRSQTILECCFRSGCGPNLLR
jgi:hypothetical protein